MSTRKSRITLVLFVAAASSCTTTGATLGSGVGDALLEHPPYFAGARPSPDETVSLGHLPIAYQRGASQAPIFDPEASAEMRRLLDSMTARLDAAGLSRRVVAGGRVSAVVHADTRFPPDVRFGCETESGQPDDDCADRGDDVMGRAGTVMQLSVGRPSSEWTAWAAGVLEDTETDRLLVITLEVGQYLVRQRGLLGHKEVELGTDHVAALPWLTSLETAVAVVQLTGAVVGRDGKVIRIGAEGLRPHRTRLAVSAIGGQELVSDDDVRALLTERRQDLPGKPLVWEAALDNLVTGLVGRSPSRVATPGARARQPGR